MAGLLRREPMHSPPALEHSPTPQAHLLAQPEKTESPMLQLRTTPVGARLLADLAEAEAQSSATQSPLCRCWAAGFASCIHWQAADLPAPGGG